MNEGWCGDEYLVLFTAAESASAQLKYKLTEYLPGYSLVGLLEWDNFIVKDANGDTQSIPTVPIERTKIAPYALAAPLTLRKDDRFTGKIKWYLKPLVFGGDPDDGANLTWIELDKHAELVVWWNEQYRMLNARTANE